MINFLRSWILNIVSVVIFITIVELILPNSSMKKYIKMIVGLLVMLVIINPILDLMHGKVKLEEDIFRTSSAIHKQELVLNLNHFKGTQQKQIISVYKGNIEKYIKDQIEFNNKIRVLSIDSSIEENVESKEFGNIKELAIVLSNSENNLSKKGIQPVSNVVININENRENDNIEKNENILKAIKEHISKYYSLDKDKININIQKTEK
ncbi:stage III sporulation protein AF [Crassaminicella profunda]|uniref:stage III sporulation protein AF n=1 Tax=Crassaminicella profunda TaxID=1286698 RepID=UPI001CA5F751|nr:stage III sporulation protein AF [Crassaminicella profunda]QZY56965.1 stage III sporulation protein AF [Crassaminicella profunda]